MTWYRFKTRRGRDFRFSPHGSLESIVFCDKISCRWVKGSFRMREKKRGTPPKKTLFYCYCIHSVAPRNTADVYIYMAVNKMSNLIDFKHRQTFLLSVAYARIKTFSSIASI